MATMWTRTRTLLRFGRVLPFASSWQATAFLSPPVVFMDPERVVLDVKRDFGKRSDYLTWEQYFLLMAMLTAKRSKDPVTQVIFIILISHSFIHLGRCVCR